MNDVDKDVHSTLHRLIDHEPVDTERALRVATTTRSSRRGPRAPVAITAAVVAVLAVAVFVPRGHPQSQRQNPPYKLVGAAGAEVVVRVDSSGPTPTAELTVGDTTVQGTEVAGHPESNGIALDEPFDPFSGRVVDVPDGSSLRVEGTFDDASASEVPWLVAADGGNGSMNVVQIGTWELDSSGGSVVFSGSGDGSHVLLVEATVGGAHHYFFFRAHVVPIGS
jgi:hypothetical protein